MNLIIDIYTPDLQHQVKDFILHEWREFGLEYDQRFDFDLDDPGEFYIRSGGVFYVLHEGDKIFGTIGLVKKTGEIAELQRFFVDKNYRGKGYGTELLDNAITFCKENNFQRLVLTSGKEFAKGHAFYLKKGFNILDEDAKDYHMEMRF